MCYIKLYFKEIVCCFNKCTVSVWRLKIAIWSSFIKKKTICNIEETFKYWSPCILSWPMSMNCSNLHPKSVWWDGIDAVPLRKIMLFLFLNWKNFTCKLYRIPWWWWLCFNTALAVTVPNFSPRWRKMCLNFFVAFFRYF